MENQSQKKHTLTENFTAQAGFTTAMERSGQYKEAKMELKKAWSSGTAITKITASIKTEETKEG